MLVQDFFILDQLFSFYFIFLIAQNPIKICYSAILILKIRSTALWSMLMFFFTFGLGLTHFFYFISIRDDITPLVNLTLHMFDLYQYFIDEFALILNLG